MIPRRRAWLAGIALVAVTSTVLAWLALRWASTAMAFTGGRSIPPGVSPLPYVLSRWPARRVDCTSFRPLTLHLAFSVPFVRFDGELAVWDSQRGVLYAGRARETLVLDEVCVDARLARPEEVELSFTWVGEHVFHPYPPSPSVPALNEREVDVLFQLVSPGADEGLAEPALRRVSVQPRLSSQAERR